jgi:hypothetical protein
LIEEWVEELVMPHEWLCFKVKFIAHGFLQTLHESCRSQPENLHDAVHLA